jgi:peptidoglycan/LPS O-acetylase OafA/YrhL
MATEASPTSLESRQVLEGGSGPGWFPCFDGLRAIAALGVFAYHIGGAVVLPQPHWAPIIVHEWLGRLGTQGVAIFFVISGFLLYRPFVVAHLSDRPAPRVVPFWLRRFARIYPAYWVAITITYFVIMPSWQPHGLPDFATFYGLAQNYRGDYQKLGLSVAWTLVIEVSFYIVLPGIAWCIRMLCRSGASRRNKLRVQVIALSALGTSAIMLRAWQLWVSTPGVTPHGAPTFDHAVNWLPGYLDWFVAGMLMAVASAWIAVGGGVPRPIAVLGRRPWISWLLALEVYWLLTRLRLPRLGFESLTLPISESQTFLAFDLYVLCAAFLVAPAVFGRQDRGTIRGALQSAPLVGLGLVSYGIYLWHIPMWGLLVQWRNDGWFPSNRSIQVLVVFAMTVGAAALSYALVERPVRLRVQRILRRGPRTTTFTNATIGSDPRPVPAAGPATIDPPERGPKAGLILVPIAVLIAVLGLALPSHFRSLPTPGEALGQAAHANRAARL